MVSSRAAESAPAGGDAAVRGMGHALRSVVPVLAASLLMLAGNGLVSTYIAMHVQLSGRPPWVAALLSTAYFAGFVVGALRCRAIVDSVGHIRAYSAFASLSAVLVLALGFFDATPFWAVARLAAGLCSAGLFVVLESWLNSRADNATRGTLLALYMVTVFVGLAAGQLPLAFLSSSGLEPPAVSAALYAASLVPLALAPSAQPEIHTGTIMGLGRLWSRSPLGVFGCLASGAMMGPFYGLAPVWVLADASRVVTVAAFMTSAILGGLALQLPLGWLSDRVDRRWVLTAVLATAAAVCLFLARPGTGNAIVTLAGGALFGGTAFLVYPLSIAHANDGLSREEFLPASGSLLLLYGTGSAAAPLVAGPIMGATGPGSLFLFIGGVSAAALAYTLWRLMRVRGVPAGEKEAFAPVTRTSPVVAGLAQGAEPGSPR